MNRIPLPLDPPGIVQPAEDLADLATLARWIKGAYDTEKKAVRNEEAAAHNKFATRYRAGVWFRQAKEQCIRTQTPWLKWIKDTGEYSKSVVHRMMNFSRLIEDIIGSTFPQGGNIPLDLDEIKRLWEEARSEDAEPPIPEYVTLDQWNAADEAMRQRLLSATGDSKFVAQGDSEKIQWALWSWNPVSGCLHNCPYCYARDIAERFYDKLDQGQRFAPTLWPLRLTAPSITSYPQDKIDEETNPVRKLGLGNVFVCSMADLFGRWVPKEWIDAVLLACAAAPQWNFLFLTKFPIRLAEFTFPDNAWVGTTVDCQARVANAEKSFRKVKAKVKWLSCEPLIEPLTFKDIGAFHWIVIGGASKSSQTPEWHPPLEWFIDIKKAADKAGVPIYPKPNFWPPQKYPGDKPSLDLRKAPEELRYLPTVEATHG